MIHYKLQSSSLFVLALIVATHANASGPPPPPPPPTPSPISVSVQFPDGRTSSTSLDDIEARSILPQDIPYDIDTFIAAAFKKLKIEWHDECHGVGTKRVCAVVSIGTYRNSSSDHWQLYHDGKREGKGINQISAMGTKQIKFVYEPAARKR